MVKCQSSNSWFPVKAIGEAKMGTTWLHRDLDARECDGP